MKRFQIKTQPTNQPSDGEPPQDATEGRYVQSRANGRRQVGWRYSCRQILIWTLEIATILGIWSALERACPAWRGLRQRIGVATKLVDERGAFVKFVPFPEYRKTVGDVVVWAAVVGVFYLIKVQIAYRIGNRVTAWLAYLVVLSLIVPYLYICWVDWGNPHITFLGDWLGTPVMVLAVPTMSFSYDVWSRRRLSIKYIVVRSLIEVVVLIPVWTVLWATVSLFVLQLRWI